jgi:hypothetical protein
VVDEAGEVAADASVDVSAGAQAEEKGVGALLTPFGVTPLALFGTDALAGVLDQPGTRGDVPAREPAPAMDARGSDLDQWGRAWTTPLLEL